MAVGGGLGGGCSEYVDPTLGAAGGGCKGSTAEIDLVDAVV